MLFILSPKVGVLWSLILKSPSALQTIPTEISPFLSQCFGGCIRKVGNHISIFPFQLIDEKYISEAEDKYTIK